MTTTMDDYIKQVVDRVPSGNPLRAQITLELKAMIGERLARGQSMDEVLRQLGDPASFADSYLSAEPLEAAPHGDRILAKIIDGLPIVLMFVVVFLLGRMMAGSLFQRTWFMFGPLALIGAMLIWPIYTIAAEYWSSATVGKRLMGLRVVQESGARITLGQAFVRQLSLVFQVLLFDCLFALFTEKRQRACELLSKTRVVRAMRAGAM
jgi:uncharacterized RDD family membrane protein YckC